MLSHEKSEQLYEKAQQRIPGGVNSPVRAFRKVGCAPIFIDRGEGARIFDVDGNSYIDYVMSWGPLIFGHAHPRIVQAITEAAARGTSYGASTEAEVRLAEKIVDAVPSIQKVRLVSSGTEAVMSAVRAARGFTKRNKIIKFEGCYHGHSDSFLAKAGSGMMTLGLPDSAGVPESVTRETITVPYNDIDSFREAMEANLGDIACVIVEPVAGNMGVVLPQSGFLETLRELTHLDHALLIFDEVITGFRVAYGGAQEAFGITPDMTILGKIVGGGLPLAAFGGAAEVMEMIAPLGPVYQAGTLSGNPVAVAAGLAQLEMLEEQKDTLYRELEKKMEFLALATRAAAQDAHIPIQINRITSMMTSFFTESPVTDLQTANQSDTRRFASFFRALLERGIYIAPSQFEAGFVSAAHSQEQLDMTAESVAEALRVLE